MPRLLTLLLLAAAGPAAAYEMDPYTWRERPLQDATAVANAHTDEILARAIARTNRQTGCALDDAATRSILAKAIERQTDPDVPIRLLPRHHNIYARVRLGENWALWLVDGCGVVRMGQVFVGTDKFDHFWDIGWVMFHRSGDGACPLDALLHSLSTEGNFRGFETSGAISYADLRANYDGFRFYVGLLGEGSVVQRGPDGCLVQTRPWDWSELVDRDWDEFLNTSRYTAGAQRGLDRWLADHGEAICALDEAARQVPPAHVPPSEYLVFEEAAATWGALPDGYDQRIDPFRRAERCPRE